MIPNILVNLFSFNVHWCLACIYAWVKLSDLVVSDSCKLPHRSWKLNLGPLAEHLVYLFTKPSLWSLFISLQQISLYPWQLNNILLQKILAIDTFFHYGNSLSLLILMPHSLSCDVIFKSLQRFFRLNQKNWYN